MENERKPLRKNLKGMIMKVLEQCSSFAGCFYSVMSSLAFTSADMFAFTAGKLTDSIHFLLWDSICLLCLSVMIVIIKRPTLPTSIKEVALLLATGFLQGAGSFVLVWALTISRPADVVSLFFTLPTFVLILNFVIYRQIQVLSILYAVISFTGVIFIVQPSFLFHEVDNKFAISDIAIGLAIASACFYAGCAICSEKLQGEFKTSSILVVVSTTCHLFLFAFILSLVYERLVLPGSKELVLLVICNGCTIYLATLFFFVAISFEKPFIVTIILTSQVFFTFISQHFILGVETDVFSCFGGTLIVIACTGIALTTRKQRTDNEEDHTNDDDDDDAGGGGGDDDDDGIPLLGS